MLTVPAIANTSEWTRCSVVLWLVCTIYAALFPPPPPLPLRSIWPSLLPPPPPPLPPPPPPRPSRPTQSGGGWPAVAAIPGDPPQPKATSLLKTFKEAGRRTPLQCRRLVGPGEADPPARPTSSTTCVCCVRVCVWRCVCVCAILEDQHHLRPPRGHHLPVAVQRLVGRARSAVQL